MQRIATWGWMAVAAFWFSANAGLATQIASFQAGDGGWQLGTLAVGNLEGGTQLDIVVPYRNSSGQWLLDAFRPDGTRLAGFPYVGNGEINVSPTLYDLEGKGRDDILFTCGASVIALRGNGSVLWSNEVSHLNYVPDSGYMTIILVQWRQTYFAPSEDRSVFIGSFQPNRCGCGWGWKERGRHGVEN
jgi:hypothetical protein